MVENQISWRVEPAWTVQPHAEGLGPATSGAAGPKRRFLTEMQAKQFLNGNPVAAGQYAEEALKLDPQALFLLGAVLRRRG